MLIQNEDYRYLDFETRLAMLQSLPTGFEAAQDRVLSAQDVELCPQEKTPECDWAQGLNDVEKGLFVGASYGVSMTYENGKSDQAALLESCRLAALELFYRNQSSLRDPYAMRVEQGEMGFSSYQRLGTDNLNQCLGVVIHDPDTKKTGLIHVDYVEDKSFWKDFFDRLPPRRSGDAPFQVRLIGARELKNKTSDAFSLKILAETLTSLQDYPVNIISACVRNKNKTRTFVVDPGSFDLFAALPFYHNPDRDISNGFATARDVTSPLHLAFDLTQSQIRAPLLPTYKDKIRIMSFVGGMTEKKYYEHFAKTKFLNIQQIPIAVHQMLALKKAHDESLSQVLTKYDGFVEEARAAGVVFHEDLIEECRTYIEMKPLHIGAQAENANAALFQYLKNDFVRKTNKNECYINRGGLALFRFARPTLSVLEQTPKL